MSHLFHGRQSAPLSTVCAKLFHKSNEAQLIDPVYWVPVSSLPPERPVSCSWELILYIYWCKSATIDAWSDCISEQFVFLQIMQLCCQTRYGSRPTFDLLPISSLILCKCTRNTLSETRFFGFVIARLPRCPCPWKLSLNILLNGDRK